MIWVHMARLMRGSVRPWGVSSRRSGEGSSVAKAAHTYKASVILLQLESMKVSSNTWMSKAGQGRAMVEAGKGRAGQSRAGHSSAMFQAWHSIGKSTV